MATVTHLTMEAGGLRLANILSQEIALQLADRASIRTSGAVTYYGSVAGNGSDTLNVRVAGLDGYDTMAAVADGADLTGSEDITSSSVSIAVARYALRRDLSDIVEFTGMGGGDITVQRLAASAVGEAEKCFMGLVGTAIAGFGTDVGTASAAMGVDDFFSATAQLEETSNVGPFYCLLKPQQLTQLQSSLRAEAGALQWMPATAELLKIKPQGYVGSFLNVDVFASASVDTTGTVHSGGMWAAGCLGWADAQPVIGFGDTIRPSGSPVTVELQRDASAALTECISSLYAGVSVIQDGMGVGITTLSS